MMLSNRKHEVDDLIPRLAQHLFCDELEIWHHASQLHPQTSVIQGPGCHHLPPRLAEGRVPCLKRKS
jgi:hypothetical protein